MALPVSFFWSFIVRPLWGAGRPGDRLRTTLSILAVGLGVGVILAIQLAHRSSIDSFESSLAEISGRTNNRMEALATQPDVSTCYVKYRNGQQRKGTLTSHNIYSANL